MARFQGRVDRRAREGGFRSDHDTAVKWWFGEGGTSRTVLLDGMRLPGTR